MEIKHPDSGDSGDSVGLSDNAEKLRQLLDAQYLWPTYYTFKFIIACQELAKINQLKDLFQHDDIKEKITPQGKYVSFTIRSLKYSSQEVLVKYHEVQMIGGFISL